jgi:formylglycine-generating enzyme required for sulfatase activity
VIIRIEINVPQWTKWLASGIALGAVLGVGGSRVYADTVVVKTTWQTGDTLVADDLNTNFANLKAAVDQLKHPSCPEDYVQDATASGIVLCKKGTDEVVKVGANNTVFWIDRYEASIWAAANPAIGTTTQFGTTAADYPASFPANGEYTQPLYALSLPSVAPCLYATWFQAETACEASGKRLPTGQEWLRAARGTVDSGTASTTGPECNCLAYSAIRNTGLGSACKSAWGAQDMIGNVPEWTAEWFAGVASSSPFGALTTWPGADFKGDGNWNIASSAADSSGNWVVGLPVAARRGGGEATAGSATYGRFALDLRVSPAGYAGFRCVLTR